MIATLALAAATLAAPAPAPNRLLVDPRTAAPLFEKGPFREPAERFRQGQWQQAADGFAAALNAKRPPPAAEVPRARFLLGLAQSSLGRFAEAATVFERLWRVDPLLRPYHAYHAAACHLRRGNTGDALKWVALVPRGSIPEAESVLIRIDALTARRRWSEVEREGTRYAEAFPAGPRSAEAAFATAVAIEAQGRLLEAADRLRKIWAESRAESWSRRAEARLATLTARLEPTEREAVRTRAQDWVARGLVLFDRHENEASEAAFATALQSAGELDPGSECRARYHQAYSVWKQRNRTRAAPLFAAAEAACQRASDRDFRARSLFQRGRCLAMLGDRKGARAEFARLEADHADHRLADDARLRAADVAWEDGDQQAAAELARTVAQRYPFGDMGGDALWQLAYRAYREGAWDPARRWLAEIRELVPRATVWYAQGRPEYWEGRILEKQGRPREAITWYQTAVRRYPLAVYALLAFGRLEAISPAAATALQRELRRPLEATRAAAGPRAAVAGLGGEARAALDRAVELARMGLGAQAHRELARLFRDQPDDRDLAGTAAMLLDRAGMWNTSHSLIDDRLENFRFWYPTIDSETLRGSRTPREASRRASSAAPHAIAGAVKPWELAYPRAYGDLVDENSRANEVPPELQLALMREESAFNPRAESPANCLGLTMLKPETARELLSRDVTREQLLDPEINLAAGARHLASLLKQYRAVVPAIAAYNAGQGAVARWLRTKGHLPVDEFLEEIPYEETRGYTKRVLASYFAYSWLYASKDRIPELGILLGRARR